MFVGIDVGARELHALALSEAGELMDQVQLGADEVSELTSWLRDASGIAIDSPDRLSTSPHGEDATLLIAPKFRTARCAEIGLLISYRLQVPWVTPTGEPVDQWMRVGIGLFELLRASGLTPIEVFPDAGFRRLAGQLKPLPKKGTRAGSAERANLLAAAGLVTAGASMWSTHWLDAALSALIARMSLTDAAIAATCGHDGSAIWIPKHSIRASP